MINGISSGISMPMPQRSEQSLTADQQTLISETLSEFDVDNLTQEDAASIIEIFSQAGIEPSEALETAISTSGFDAKTIGELANASEGGNRPPPPPPPQQSTDEITSMVDYLTELMEEKLATSNSSSLSEEDKQTILAQMIEKFDIEDGDSIINTSA
jgi:hypothetical protein